MRENKGEIMKLLILGAGGHGKVVKEIAEAIFNEDGSAKYEKISFLDDNSPEAIGKLSDIEILLNEYPCAFVGIGNNAVRKAYIQKLEALGYEIPVLIHPTAYVSKSAKIEKGSVIEPKAIVNANSHIDVGCIISVGAIVDHDVEVGTCCHVNAGAICKAGSVIETERKLQAGEVVLGY